MESVSGISKTKISDSGYSNSCSNSNSHSSASPKSKHSGSNSSGSSGYCGTANPDESTEIEHQPSKRSKERKKKKAKVSDATAATSSLVAAGSCVDEKTACFAAKEDTSKLEEVGVEVLPSSTPETVIPTVNAAENSETTINPSPLIPVTADTPPADTDVMCWTADEEQVSPVFKTPPSEAPRNVDVCRADPKTGCQLESGFCCVMSMCDGVVLYTTPGLTTALGFPKDTWLGRSFVDFLHPKDREIFSSQVTTGIAVPFADSQGKHKDIKNCLYVYLRKYRSIRSSGFGVVDKMYQAFHLTVTFRHLTNTPETKKYFDANGGMFLVVVANPVFSNYKVPEEKVTFKKLGMRHTAACIFSHVDPDVVTNFGFLPQDMLGKSIFDFYHPEDMSFLKEVYESVMTMCQIAGSVFRSKPYRFAVQNGGFVMIETEWSSFVNPWSRRLEFVIGLHRVLQGPKNPDIFDQNRCDEKEHVSKEVMKESKIIQQEILVLLNKERSRPFEVTKQEVTKRCKDLATLMDYIMEEVNNSTLQLDLPAEPEATISERGSVMLGEISPHHDYCESKSSSETPPSYNQLNYNENIQRFFQSKPKTTLSDESSQRPRSGSNDTDPEEKLLQIVQRSSNNQKCTSPVENSGDSGSGSGGNQSSIGHPKMESVTSGTNTSNGSYMPPHLTEAILYKHNEDMEKIMMKLHREQRAGTKEREFKKSQNQKKDKSPICNYNSRSKNEGVKGQGVKRNVPRSWKGKSRKVSKSRHQSILPNNAECNKAIANNHNPKPASIQLPPPLLPPLPPPLPPPPPPPAGNSGNVYQHTVNDANLWLPFCATVTPFTNTQTMSLNPNPSSIGFTGMYPVCYIPAPAQQRHCEPNFSDTFNCQFQYVSGMGYNYNTMVPATPMLYPHLPLISYPIAPPLITTTEVNTPGPTNFVKEVFPELHKLCPQNVTTLPTFQRPASQATSVKAEPGSALSSIASASVANKAMSECSRKDLTLQSVCSPSSPLVSPPDGEAQMESFQANSQIAELNRSQETYRESTVVDDESLSSSHSSYMKTDYGSGSNDDTTLLDSSDPTIVTDDDSFNMERKVPVKKQDPPWMGSVKITPEVISRYQMDVKKMGDILEADLKAQETLNQPTLVNDQLNQLYAEMELEGSPTKLKLEEGIPSSRSSSSNNFSSSYETRAGPSKQRKKTRDNRHMTMIS